MLLAQSHHRKILAASLSFFLLVSIFILPFMVSGAEDIPGTEVKGGIVTCGDPGQKTCDFDGFIDTINSVISWILSIAGVIFAISFIYGGFLYMTSGVKPGNKDKAKSILYSTLWGLIIILTAWVIVYTILNTLVRDSSKESVFEFIKKI